MRVGRRCQTFLSTLVAFSFVLGTVTPVQACACRSVAGGRCKGPLVPSTAMGSGLSTTSPAPRPKPCCCPPGKLKGDCCCRDKIPVQASPAARVQDPTCSCIQCDCDDARSTPALPAGGGASLMSSLLDGGTGTLTPPNNMLPVALQASPFCDLVPRPPSALAISLTRLTC